MAGARELTHASHEQYHTTDTKKASNIIDLLKDFCPGESLRIDSRRWKVEDGGQNHCCAISGSSLQLNLTVTYGQ